MENADHDDFGLDDPIVDCEGKLRNAAASSVFANDR